MNISISKTFGVVVFMLLITQAAIAETARDCSPEYWKQEISLVSWEHYKPHSLFTAAGFENAFPGMSMLDVLNLEGDGLNALGRHAVSALLNATSSDLIYPYEASEVVAMFNTYYEFLARDLKNAFEEFNDLSCSIG